MMILNYILEKQLWFMKEIKKLKLKIKLKIKLKSIYLQNND